MYFILRGVGGELKHIWSPGRRGGQQGAELSQKVRCGGPGGDGQAGGTGRVGRRRGAGSGGGVGSEGAVFALVEISVLRGPVGRPGRVPGLLRAQSAPPSCRSHRSGRCGRLEGPVASRAPLPPTAAFPEPLGAAWAGTQTLSGRVRHTFKLQETLSPPSVVLAGSRSQTSKALVTKRADQGSGWPRALGRLRGLQTFRECCKPRVTRPPRRPPSRIAHRTPSQGRERNPAPDRRWPDARGSRPVLAKGVIRADAGERGRVPRCVQWPWRRQGPGPRWASRPVTEEDNQKSVGEEKALLS